MPHTLLLADDSVTIQRVIELTFADEDIRVVSVSDGKQAVQQAQAEAPDIVLADVGMPEMDGYEVAAFIKGTPGLSHIPVLLLTGAFEPIDEGRAREVGCDGVLVKPFEPQMVISRVKDLIAGRRVGTPVPPRPGGIVMPPFTAPPPATDEYFDRLDAALSSFDSTATITMAPPAPSEPVHEERGDSLHPAAGNEEPTLALPVPPPLRAVTEPVPAEPTPADAPSLSPAPAQVTQSAPAASLDAPPTPAPSSSSPLVEAFEALLAVERGHPLESVAAQRLGSSDTLIEHITRKVIERLADDRMRDTVIEVAERMVREEIDRIKSTAGN